jgi:hypothetical protein
MIFILIINSLLIMENNPSPNETFKSESQFLNNTSYQTYFQVYNNFY